MATKFNIGDKLSLKVKKHNATCGRWVRETDSYEMLDNVDVGVVHIATGGRGWYTENEQIALVDPTKNIRVKVIDVEDRVAKCEVLVGKSFKTTNFAKRPYMKTSGLTNPQVKLGEDNSWNTFGQQYGVRDPSNYNETGPVTVWVAFRHLEKR